MQVLIVDDDPLVLKLLGRKLESAGWDVLTALNGELASEVLRSCDCQLVISDWEMPVMNGIEFCQAIRAGLCSRYIYFIMISGRYEQDSAVVALTAGADDFVTKPIDPPELIQRLYAGVRLLGLQTMDITIFALAKLADSRNPKTGQHLERVRAYSRILTSELRDNSLYGPSIDQEFIELMPKTSPLHDIGKVAIPDSVLLKPGKLNDAEFAIMKTHVEEGAITLSAALVQFPTARFLQMARDIVLYHHERWNGKGYPDGLAGESIPLCGRIVALADVYDALTSKRVYKDAMTHHDARHLIVTERGQHFDPRVVDAFLACEDAFIAVRKNPPANIFGVAA